MQIWCEIVCDSCMKHGTGRWITNGRIPQKEMASELRDWLKTTNGEHRCPECVKRDISRAKEFCNA